MINLIKKKGINPQTKSTLYFPQWTRIATVDEKQLAKRMARGSTYSVGEVSGMMHDFPAEILDELLDGNAVRVDGLGTFKLRVSGKARADIKDVSSQGCSVTVTFDPDPELTARLNAEREFRFVTKPTEEGEQDAAENPTSGGLEPTEPALPGEPNEGGNTGGNGGGGNQGGGTGIGE